VASGREAAPYTGNWQERKNATRAATHSSHAGLAVNKPIVAVIGAGPAGLMAAETLAPFARVVVFDRMAAPARKFMMAGRGGLNLTHSEALPAFLERYRHAAPSMRRAIEAFPPEALRAWAEGLGQEMFIGSSGRVFPRAMKASPLLRAWLARLASQGVSLRTRHDWQGWTQDGALRFATPQGEELFTPDATILALGGASWPRLGADGGWTRFFPKDATTPFAPSNMGFHVAWSAHLRARGAGQPLKRIAITFGETTVRGEAMITDWGIEGGAIYALSAPLREAIAAQGHADIALDLRPDMAETDLPSGQGSRSLSNQLRSAGLSPVAVALVQEARHAGADLPLPRLIKALPLRLTAPAPLARAISSAGGLRWRALGANFMLHDRPGVFAAGEMLDWEAPTGGYLLQGCFSTAIAAANAARSWLEQRP
jgi:uncharacterized flavoprotein (TIGR03862 family)